MIDSRRAVCYRISNKNRWRTCRHVKEKIVMIPVPEKRIADFENMGFGMFIHYGLYSQLGQGEWIMNSAQMSREDYAKLADNFTAADFDAKKIARTAKESGMKYITLTTRHHDGFSLYDTKGLSDFDAPHSAAGRDLVREFVDACNAEGLLPIFYHTTIDWHVDSYEKDTYNISKTV